MFAKLKKAGLISSIRGTNGGYQLAKPAGEISVGDVLRALEGEMVVVDCPDSENKCAKFDSCVTKYVWKRINNSINDTMDSMTLRRSLRTARKLKTKPVKKHIAQNNIYEWREDKMDKRIIYLDHAATTATRPEVVEAMLPYFTENYGNPSTVYDLGAKNKTVVTESREIIAKALGTDAANIYFTAGGSESDNWALVATAEAYKK